MIVYRCDACGRRMTGNDPGRYIIKLEAYGAAGPLEFTQADLARDHTQEIRRIIESLETQSPDQVEDEIYRSFRYDLCAVCHRRFLAQDLPGLQGLRPE